MKTINNIIPILAIILVATTLNSCKKDDTAPTVIPSLELVKIGETTLVGNMDIKAEVYSMKAFETGMNLVYVKLMDPITEKEVTSGSLDVNPMMDMGTMMHSTPIENRTSQANDMGYFTSSIYYIMPGNATQWALNLMHIEGTDTAKGKLGIDVVSSDPKRMISTILKEDNDARTFIAMVDTGTWMEGLNDFELVIFTRENMMTHPAVEDYTIEIEPEMPAHGHGSSMNENPIHIGKGHYKGKVHLSMGGNWVIHLKIYKNGKLLSEDHSFEIDL